jgi:protein-tyrosine phosphatase
MRKPTAARQRGRQRDRPKRASVTMLLARRPLRSVSAFLVPSVRMPKRVLMVCTANVCRSPMAAAMLQHHLDAADVDVVVSSAGTNDSNDLAVDPHAVAALAEWGIDLRAHHPRVLTTDIAATDGADLIVTMQRQHLRHGVALDNRTWQRSFTLRELVRRITGTTANAATDFAAWTSMLSAGRKAAEMMGDSAVDDVNDPYGQGATAVGHTARNL